jgi:multidrug resistance efflux pump
MEIIITAVYGFVIWLLFKKFKWLKMNVFWGFGLAGLWFGAIGLEIITLMQFTPVGNAVVQCYVVQVAPSLGGEVETVFAQSNMLMQKGDPIFQMNQTLVKDQLEKSRAALSTAQTLYADLSQAAKNNAVALITLDKASNSVHTAQADLESAEYHLEKSTVRAPSDGYAVNLQLRPGTVIRLKEKVISFVDTETYWMVLKIPQFQAKRIRPGDAAEFRLDMYPGKVFPAEVESVVWATRDAQTQASGTLPSINPVPRENIFVVRIKLTDQPNGSPLRFGAGGKAAVYTRSAPNVLVGLRKLILRMESWMVYIGLS